MCVSVCTCGERFGLWSHCECLCVWREVLISGVRVCVCACVERGSNIWCPCVERGSNIWCPCVYVDRDGRAVYVCVERG